VNNEILSKFEIMQGDITRLEVDAIVNAANSSLLGGGGVDGAIHRAAGPELLAECKTIGGCPAGEARITNGYNLPARYVIHTVGPVYSGAPSDPQVLRNCYENCLFLAVQHRISTVAFPAIGCGAYQYPIAEATRIALTASYNFLNNNNIIKKIHFVLFSKGDQDEYTRQLKELKEPLLSP
jgi:O-acetyl-ADP-ribose deacetylase (regulator of RNase III)